MLPAQLTSESFSQYPAEARAVAVRHTDVLKQIPLAFVPLVLRELIGYDWKFPAERADLDRQLAYLREKSAAALSAVMQPFAALNVPDDLAAIDWVNQPAEFSERLSASLWATHQIDAFRKASIDYVHALNVAKPPVRPALPRLTVVLIGRDQTKQPAEFRKLRPLGVHYTNIVAKNPAALVDLISSRATAAPEPFAHWYIDGADCVVRPASITCVSYASLEPVRKALLARMTQVMAPGGGGPELLRSELQRMRPEDVDFAKTVNPVLSRFELSLLTEGSGTQIFSTTFVQWTAREVLRRAQPSTLFVRFASRRREAPIGAPVTTDAVDPDGSLVDAEMGAYYTWINQQRLSNADQSRFIAWDESHNHAVAIGPALHPGTEEPTPMHIEELVANLS
jgi:hypothetical protein